MNHRSLLAVALITTLGASGLAAAEDVGQHPAVFAPRSLPGVNPNTFIVGHPASPRNRVVHANADHPAVRLAAERATGGPAIDANHFIVQPPASVRWTLNSEPSPVQAALPAAPVLAAR